VGRAPMWKPARAGRIPIEIVAVPAEDPGHDERPGRRRTGAEPGSARISPGARFTLSSPAWAARIPGPSATVRKAHDSSRRSLAQSRLRAARQPAKSLTHRAQPSASAADPAPPPLRTPTSPPRAPHPPPPPLSLPAVTVATRRRRSPPATGAPRRHPTRAAATRRTPQAIEHATSAKPGLARH
jgi:hypothetical protein